MLAGKVADAIMQELAEAGHPASITPLPMK
jgi:hypothetical protein